MSAETSQSDWTSHHVRFSAVCVRRPVSDGSASRSTCSAAHLTGWDVGHEAEFFTLKVPRAAARSSHVMDSQAGETTDRTERHRPVYEARLQTQTVNNEVSQDVVVQLDVSNET